MNRRSYLKGLGGAAAVTAVSAVIVHDGPGRGDGNGSPPGGGHDDGGGFGDRDGQRSTSTVSSERRKRELRERFDTVVNVSNVGADPTGTEPVDPVLTEHAGDGTVLWFPPGRYHVDRVRFDGLTNFGMAGRDATLRVGRRGSYAFLLFRQATDVLVDGFTVDCTDDETAAWVDFRCIGGENRIRNYRVRGFGDVAERTNGFTLMVEGADTALTIERADLSAGAKNGAAAFVFPRRAFTDPGRRPGTLTFRDCVMKGWGKEGLYASPHGGPLRVIGGEYANNAIDQIRIGGGNGSSTAIVRDAEVRIDRLPSYTPERNRVYRGIWLEEGDRATVVGCDLSIGSLSDGTVQTGITVNEQFGRAEIQDCRIRMDAETPAIRIEPPIETLGRDDIRVPSLRALPPAWNVRCRNVAIEGTGANTDAVILRDRNGCRFENVSIVQRGEQADGIRLVNVDDCIITGGSIRTTRFPALLDRPERTNERCRLALRGVRPFTGTTLEDFGRKIVEGQTPDLGPFSFPTGIPRLSIRYCLADDHVARLLQDEQRLALTGTREGWLYARVVPYRVIGKG